MKSLLTGILLLATLSLATAKGIDTAAASKQIDSLLAKDWAANKLKGNAPASDEIFVRRIYCDISGRIPTYRETEEFLADKNPAKRAKLIDKLLAGEGYVLNFFNYWADVLRAQTSPQGGGPAGPAYLKWIKDSLRTNKPWDKMVSEMITANGDVWDGSPIGYYMRDRNMPLDNMANTTRIFLGTRIECAQCHNHPFDKWTQMQFYQMAAFTYGINGNEYGSTGPVADARKMIDDKYRAPDRGKDGNKINYKTLTDAEKAEMKTAQEKARKEKGYYSQAFQDIRDPLRYTNLSDRDRNLQLPHDYTYPDAKPKSVVQASVMFGNPVTHADGVRDVEGYAKWMTSKDNPRFSTVIANRLWKRAFGLGLIEPVDEILDTTVPMNPVLMKHLEGLIKDVNFDMKAYLRILYNTQAYQRSVSKEEVPAGVNYHFTGPVLRRMSAEQMWDSFVTLMNPTPDMPNAALREFETKRIANVKKLNDALGVLSPDEIVKGLEVAANNYRNSADKTRELQKQIAEARVAEDKVKAKALGSELNKFQREGRITVNNNIFVPGIKRLEAQQASLKPGEKATGKPGDPVIAAAGGEMMNGETMMNAMQSYAPNDGKPSEAVREAQQKQILDEARYFGIPEKQQKDYARSRERTMREWLRASEMNSPAPNGHYLRLFGQSDRETIENTNSDATVPQALALMNSDLLPKILDKHSALGLILARAQYPDEQLEAAYITLFSRKPTANEKAAWSKAQDNGQTTQIEDLIFALMNTQQFIFIQ